MSAKTLAITLLAGIVCLTGCEDTKTKTSSTAPAPSCAKDKTVARAEYDRILSLRYRRVFGSSQKISVDEREELMLNSAKMILLFESDLKACVVEPDGRISSMKWTQENLNLERGYLEYLAGLDGQSSSKPPAALMNTQAPRTLYSGTATLGRLQSFVEAQVREAIDAKKVNLEFEELSAHGSTGVLKSEELKDQAENFYRRRFELLQSVVVQSLSQSVTHHTSSRSQLNFAGDMPALQPVLAYFKTQYGEDLSKVVVIDGPISLIPHAGTGLYGNAIGLFIPPLPMPIKITVKLPMRELDPQADKSAYLSGTLKVTFSENQKMQNSMLDFYFQSRRLIYVDLEKIKTTGVGKAGAEAIFAHELRHLLDYFNCDRTQADFCDMEKVSRDWKAVEREGESLRQRNLDLYNSDPGTRQSRAELAQLFRKYRPNGSAADQDKFADGTLQQIFDANYLPTYTSYFSIKEKRGYKEQLQYLLVQGLTKTQAIQMARQSSIGERLPIEMDGTKETFNAPVFAWIDQLFRSLF